MPVFRPGKPYRLGRLTADTAVAAGTTTIPYNSFDSDGDFSSGTTGGQVVVALAGLYLVVHSICTTTTSGGGSHQASILLNGTERAKDSPPLGAGRYGSSVTIVEQLDVGDTLTFACLNSGGVTLESEATEFSIVRIGPVRWT